MLIERDLEQWLCFLRLECDSEKLSLFVWHGCFFKVHLRQDLCTCGTGFISVSFLYRPGVITMQALSEEDRRLWMEAMDGREPVSTIQGSRAGVKVLSCLLLP